MKTINRKTKLQKISLGSKYFKLGVREPSVPADFLEKSAQEQDPVFKVAKSTIPGAGMGLFAMKDLPIDYNLGRYIGQWRTVEEHDELTDEERSYVWAIMDYPHNRKRRRSGLRYNPKRILGFVDGISKRHSNYLRYINHPTSKEMENVVAQQYGNRMYYFTLRKIKAGEELFVNYGPNYSLLLLGYII